ncbi:MAG: hypothetical protein AAFV49_23840, partial [Pseudomonadota bacterium]
SSSSGGRSEDLRRAYELLARVERDRFGDLETASVVLSRARRLWPRSWRLHFEAGVLLRRRAAESTAVADATHCLLEARAALARALDNPAPPSPQQRSRVLTTAALVEADLGNRAEAEALFDACVAAHPAHGAAYAARGDCALKKWRDPDAARRAFRAGLEALRAEPKAFDRYAPGA